jgi:hypothetical protein
MGRPKKEKNFRLDVLSRLLEPGGLLKVRTPGLYKFFETNRFFQTFLHYSFKNMDTAPKQWEKISDADPDPGSGNFLTPGSGMGKKSGSGSGMNNLDHIYESLNFFDANPGWKIFGSGMEKIRIRNTGKSVWCRHLLKVSRARWYSLSARSNSLESVLTCSRVTPIPVRSFALLQLVNLIPASCGVIMRRRRSQGRGSSLSYFKT